MLIFWELVRLKLQHHDYILILSENIHHMRDGIDRLRKLTHTYTVGDSSWLVLQWTLCTFTLPHQMQSKLDSTNWLSHIHTVLKGSVKIMKYVLEGSSVVIHCRYAVEARCTI